MTNRELSQSEQPLDRPAAAPNHALDDEPNRSRYENNVTPTPTTPPPKRFVTPEELIGFPKAKELKIEKKRRTKGKSAIMTDTPELLVIEMKEREKLKEKFTEEVWPETEEKQIERTKVIRIGE